MNELYAVLLSWATTLSGYPTPNDAAKIVRVSHEVLVQRACGGRECKVLGWYPPGERIYLDERLAPGEDLLAASIVVHEMVHYLQYKSGAFEGFSCAKSIDLEREAYAIQREFLLRYGVYRPVGVNAHRVGCVLAHEADVDVGAVPRGASVGACADGARGQERQCEPAWHEQQLTEPPSYSYGDSYGEYIDEHRQTTSWLPTAFEEGPTTVNADQGAGRRYFTGETQ